MIYEKPFYSAPQAEEVFLQVEDMMTGGSVTVTLPNPEIEEEEDW